MVSGVVAVAQVQALLLAGQNLNTCRYILAGGIHENSRTHRGTIRQSIGKAVIQRGGSLGSGVRWVEFIAAAAPVFNGEIDIQIIRQGHLIEGDGDIFQRHAFPCACGGVLKVLAVNAAGTSALPSLETSQIAAVGLP